MRRIFVVNALWDGDAGVWVATSDDVPGLATEAATPKSLIAKLRVMVPELLELNSPRASKKREVVVDLRLERRERVLVAA